MHWTGRHGIFFCFCESIVRNYTGIYLKLDSEIIHFIILTVFYSSFIYFYCSVQEFQWLNNIAKTQGLKITVGTMTLHINWRICISKNWGTFRSWKQTRAKNVTCSYYGDSSEKKKRKGKEKKIRNKLQQSNKPKEMWFPNELLLNTSTVHMYSDGLRSNLHRHRCQQWAPRQPGPR